MEQTSSQSNHLSTPLEVHKLYRPIEFKLTSVYDSGKFAEKGDSNPAATSTDLTPRTTTVTQYEFQTSWKNVHKIGPGFVNAGNTCFLNSVLQMLVYTPPFANYLLEKVHSKKCKRKDSSQFCALCAFETHVNKCFNGNSKTLQPTEILRNIKMINKKFRIGRQEDAQEFLRDLIDSFQKSATGFLDKPPQKVLENTDISRLFGGKLKSTVECKSCHHKSEIFESFFDLSLELSKSESIEKCMEVFFRAEELKGANKYRCSNCKKLVEATKKFSIHQRPLVLTVHLKRFDNVFMRINKISRHIKFNETISLNPYVSEKSAEPLLYDLHGIVIHMGSFCSSGHYFSYVKNSNNVWHLMNDEDVRTSKIDKVLSQNAYLLTYVLRSAPKKVEIIPQPKAEAVSESKIKTMETEEPRKQPVKESAQKVKAQLNGAVKPVESKEEKKEQKQAVKPGVQTPKEKMVVENGTMNGETTSVGTPKKMVVENGKADGGISQPNKKKMKMEEDFRPSASTGKEKVQSKMQNEETSVSEEKTENTFERLSKINKTDFAGSTGLNGLLSHLGEHKKGSEVIDDIFKKGGKKDKIERSKTAVAPSGSRGNDMEEEVKEPEKKEKAKLNGSTEENRVKENEKIPYSAQLEALLDQKEAKVYMKNLDNAVTKNKASPIKRSLSMGNVPHPVPEYDDEENENVMPVKKPVSIVRVSSTMLKKSPFEKLKRIAKVISLFPVKKRKVEVKELEESYNGHMETEEAQVPIVKPVKAQQMNGKAEQKEEHQQQPQQKQKQKQVKQQNQQQSQGQPQQQQKWSPKKEKRYFLKGDNELKGLEKDVEEWEVGEDGDINEVGQMAEQKKKVETENLGFFITPKKVKDEYDAEYDKGKVKKVKKKKAGGKKKANNFQKTYEYIKRAGRKYNR